MLRTTLVFASLLALAAPAQASQFDITPLSLSLSEKQASGTLKLTNRSKDTLRFHIKAVAWSESESGEMKTRPTKDIVFFPAMVTLRPKEARQIRVGTRLKPGAVERTYRVTITELPPLTKSKGGGPAVKMLTKMGLPIFVQARSPNVQPVITTPTVRGQQAHFTVENHGNTHMSVQKVVLQAKGPDGVVHTDELDGWYVLANGRRKYVVELPADACEKATALEVEMETAKHGTKRASLPQFRCGG